MEALLFMIEGFSPSEGHMYDLRDSMQRRAAEYDLPSPLVAYMHERYHSGRGRLSWFGGEELRHSKAGTATSGASFSPEDKKLIAEATGDFLLGNIAWGLHTSVETGVFPGREIRERHALGATGTVITGVLMPDFLIDVHLDDAPEYHDALKKSAEEDPTLAKAIEEELYPPGFKRWVNNTWVQNTTVKTLLASRLPEYRREAGLLVVTQQERLERAKLNAIFADGDSDRKVVQGMSRNDPSIERRLAEVREKLGVIDQSGVEINELGPSKATFTLETMEALRKHLANLQGESQA